MIHRKLQYHPKGGMCANCVNKYSDCSDLDFSSMPRICKGNIDGFVVVNCVQFKIKQKTVEEMYNGYKYSEKNT